MNYIYIIIFLVIILILVLVYNITRSKTIPSLSTSSILPSINKLNGSYNKIMKHSSNIGSPKYSSSDSNKISRSKTMPSVSNNFIVGSSNYSSPSSNKITVYSFDPNSVITNNISSISIGLPSYFTISKDRQYIYSIEEIGTTGINSLRYNKDDTDYLSFVNKLTINNIGPVYISIDTTMRYLIVSNFTKPSDSTYSLYVLSIGTDGSIDSIVQTIEYDDSQIHSAILSPDNKYVFSCDWNNNSIHICSFDPTLPQPLTKLSTYNLPNSTTTNSTTTNSTTTSRSINIAPRHSTFHPKNNYYYVITEKSTAIYVFKYNINGTIELIEIVSLLPDNYQGPFGNGADIHILNNGKYLYATTRGNLNQIRIFSIDSIDGTLTLIDIVNTNCANSRTFTIDPSNNWLFYTSSDKIIIYSIDTLTGLLSDSSNITCDTPAIVTFI